MSLEEFVQTEKLKLEQFEKFWIEQNKNNSEIFPKDMNPGEWDEQFSDYLIP